MYIETNNIQRFYIVFDSMVWQENSLIINLLFLLHSKVSYLTQ